MKILLAFLTVLLLQAARERAQAQSQETPETSHAAVQTGRIELHVARTQVTADQPLLFEVRLFGEIYDQYPLLSGGDDFKLTLLGKRSAEIKGQRSVTFLYQLFPARTGTLFTPSVEVRPETGNIVRADPLLIEVLPGKSPALAGEEVFVAQAVERGEIFVGQQLINTISVYSQRELRRPQFEDLSYEHFWHYPLGDTIEEERRIGGERYHVAEIRRLLYPKRDGRFTIPERTLRALVIRLVTKDYPSFGGLFSMRTHERTEEPISMNSNPLELIVRPLPEAPPDLIAGAPLVGATRIHFSIESAHIRVGDSLAGSLVIESSANLKNYQEPRIEAPNSIRTYPQSPKIEIASNNAPAILRYTMPFTLVATEPGDFSIAAAPIPYFDPERIEYFVARGEVYRLKVTGSPALPHSQAEQMAPISVPTSAKDMKVEPTVSQFAVETETWDLASRRLSPWTLVMYVLAGLVIVLVVVLIARSLRMSRSWRAQDEVRHTLGNAAVLSEIREQLSALAGTPIAPERESLRQALKSAPLTPEELFLAQTVLDRIFESGLPLDEVLAGQSSEIIRRLKQIRTL